MKFTVIIPARGGSKGLKNKNIINFYNKPLIFWTITEALKSKFVDRVIVSTDSKEIQDISLKCGASVPFLRPKSLSGDKASTLSAVKYTMKKLIKDENYSTDYIITLQPTSPLRNKKNIEEAINKILEDKNADSLVSCVYVPHNFLPESLMKMNGNTLKPKLKQLFLL